MPRRAEAGGQRHDLKSICSATRCSSSIATSPPPLPASVGPTHFLGWALRSTQEHTSLAALVEEGDRDRPWVEVALALRLEPGEQAQVADQTALEGDVVGAVDVRHLAHVVVGVVAVAVLGVLDLVAEPAHVGEAADDLVLTTLVAQLHEEVEGAVRVVAGAMGHCLSLRVPQLCCASAVHWPMRKMTNSAG